MPTWNADTYLQFDAERTRPCRDLVAAIPLSSPRDAVDLGCGPGNSTAALRERWPGLPVTGIDSSDAMLAKARAALPGVAFEAGSIEAWTGEVDLILSNAALQWVPDHAHLLPRLLTCVRPGGVLAFQVPANFDAPAHTAMRVVATRAPFAAHLQAVREWHVLATAEVYDAVAPHARTVDLWETEYQHVLDGAEAIVSWYRGTGMRPFLDALPPALRGDFEAAFLEEIRPAFPARVDGKVLFPFLRRFGVVVR